MAAEAAAARPALDAGAHSGWAPAPAPLPSPPATNAAGLAPSTNLESFLLSTTPVLGTGHSHTHAPICQGLHCRQCSSRSKERAREKEKEKEIEREQYTEGAKEQESERDGKAHRCLCGVPRECFILEDVWESYREWSLFGSGVPLWESKGPQPAPGQGRAQGLGPAQGQGGAGGAAPREIGPGSSVGPTRAAGDPAGTGAGYSASVAVQYYIPYLSALQLYSAPCKAPSQPGQHAAPQRTAQTQQARPQGVGAEGVQQEPNGKGKGTEEAVDRASGNAVAAAEGEVPRMANANGPTSGGSESASLATKHGALVGEFGDSASLANHREETTENALERADNRGEQLSVTGEDSKNEAQHGTRSLREAAAAEHPPEKAAPQRSGDAASNAAASSGSKPAAAGEGRGDVETASIVSTAVTATASSSSEGAPDSSMSCPTRQSASPCCCCCSGRTRELLFEFLERAPPHSRPPLLEKIIELKSSFPDIMELCSSQLHPDSWFSVAWYPLYRIPAGPPLQDTSASFLTYHGLSSVACCHTRAGATGPPGPSKANVKHDCRCFKALGPPQVQPLEPFALSSYKTKGSMRAPGPLDISSSPEGEKALSSKQAAAVAWVKHVGAHHPDHEFFMAHSSR